MMYFSGINNIEQAKLRYRKLAKQVHPDAGGTAYEFQKMQNEYKTLLIRLQQKKIVSALHETNSAENILINRLGKLAKVLIKSNVPQYYLRNKIKATDSCLKRSLIIVIVNLLDKNS
nr:hypothetical protein [uncultured Carboxylicivirga sp.]